MASKWWCVQTQLGSVFWGERKCHPVPLVAPRSCRISLVHFLAEGHEQLLLKQALALFGLVVVMFLAGLFRFLCCWL